MQIIQTRRDFLASASLAGAAGVLGARRIARRRGAAGDDHDPPDVRTRPSASRPLYVAEELLRAEGFTDVRYVSAGQRRQPVASMIAQRRGRLRPDLRRHGRLSRWMPACRSRRWRACMSGCFELFAHEPIRSHQRPEGQARRHPDARLERASLPLDHGDATSGSTRTRTSTGCASPTATPWSCSPTARSTPFSAFRPSRRSCAPASIGRVILNTAMDQPWSQYFCCMIYGNRDCVRESSGRHQALPACDPQGGRLLRRRAGDGGATPGRWRLHAAATTMRCRR